MADLQGLDWPRIFPIKMGPTNTSGFIGSKRFKGCLRSQQVRLCFRNQLSIFDGEQKKTEDPAWEQRCTSSNAEETGFFSFSSLYSLYPDEIAVVLIKGLTIGSMKSCREIQSMSLPTHSPL